MENDYSKMNVWRLLEGTEVIKHDGFTAALLWHLHFNTKHVLLLTKHGKKVKKYHYKHNKY